MPIGYTPEHRTFADSVAGFARRHAPVEATRADLDALSAGSVPAFWDALVAEGVPAVHLPEEFDGAGAGLLDLAVALEESGRALLPGPLLPTVVTSAVLARYAGPEAGKALLPAFAEGATGAVAVTAGLTAHATAAGWEVNGATGPVPGAANARHLLLGARDGSRELWFVVTPAETDAVAVEPLTGVDLARGAGRVKAHALEVASAQVLTGVDTEKVRRLAAVLASAEAVGVARWCFETAVEYVKIREQFGRAVGSFQAVKHKAANLFTRLQVMTAAAWDAARAADETGPGAEAQLELAAAEAAVTCLPAAREIALDCITMLGGIGFTWEHDINFYWRRAVFLGQLLGPAGTWAELLGRRALESLSGGPERRFDLELDGSLDAFRAEVAANLARAAELDEPARRHFLADECGYVSPHYPKPYGVGADPARQIVIQQEFAAAGLTQPSTIIGEFALPTIMAHGTDAQKDRFVPATLRGDIVWCQLFSEPGAGSDLASLSTRAEKVDGGWRISGQKVWNSKAHEAHFGICLARTDQDVPKHKGITYFIVDMSTSGIDVRPLKQTNGQSEFNEVFLADVFVPDDMVVGDVNGGWAITRTTLANERVMIAGGPGMAAYGKLLRDIGAAAGTGGAAAVPAATLGRLGAFAAENWALRALTLRSTLQQLSGLNPGAASSVLKLAVTEHQRAVVTARLDRAAEAGLAAEGAAEELVTAYLSIPAVLLGGGTREIQLNVVAERILGLPRG
ncbi:acyl-CoA dehydrogenase [Yinghuangia seranimata]|uniref:acyl-CoA dehydrogenase n=1 Tax=Yinghuangia seranimata TaxID=408067 RepID=UPI00248D1D66|nr:acyl-CoA dehydrogenase [Yinghuangia seranimata]MDI2131802.1 acyl-CoA dehydrogenase [Yinghuangia seranimata]